MTAAKLHGPKNGASYVSRAQASWGQVPDWVRMLALACDMAPSQGDVARKLGCSASVISDVIANRYKGRNDRIEARVRGVLMSAEVYCPAAGMNLSRNACVDNQQRKPSTASPLSAKFPRACAACVNFLGGNK